MTASERDNIRQRIRYSAQQRKRADADKAVATANLVRYLRAGIDAGISHSEAARLAGLTRNGAYHLLRQPERTP